MRARPSEARAAVLDMHDRWCAFLQVHGVQTLHRMPAAEAYALWKACMRDPLWHAYDWHCLQPCQLATPRLVG